MSVPVPDPVAPDGAIDGVSIAPVPRPAESASRLMHPSRAEPAMLDTEILGEIASGLATAVGETAVLGEGVIERVRLLATEGYDAWLMSWGPGATVAPHDHDGSIGVLHVIDGLLIETVTDDDGPVERFVESGATTAFAATHRHALTNPGERTCRTVNVYSPPLGTVLPT